MAGIRVGGLASGMDIDQIITDLMKAERMPLDKLAQKKQYLEWQRDDYRSINKSLLELDQLIFDGVLRQSSFSKKTVSVSNPGAVSIKNINSTADFSGSIQVKRLASAASMYSKASSTIDSTAKLSDLGITGPITIEAIGKDGSLNTKQVTIDPEKDTLDTLIVKINSQTDVSAYFDKASGKFSISAKNTGDVAGGPEIVLGGDLNFWSALNMDLTSDDAVANNVGTAGVNAEIVYNGMPIVRSSNTFAINGVEISLKAVTDGPVTFSSATDTDAILDTIVKFVDQYNSLIEKIKGELEEKRYRDFQPLTSEQKDSMNEKDIERWEEKARSGTLRGDSILSGALNKMRMDLYTAVSGIAGKNQLAEIGIKTSSNYMDGGKLVIDTDKLRAALTENPNGVYEIFAKNGGTSAEQGLGRRLRDTIKSTMLNIEKRAGKASSTNNAFTLGRNLLNIDSQINRFEDRLIKVEDRYWRQFTAMEKAIQKANSQSAYLMQQFSY
ncbi:flagellar hook-associated protein 2 [Mesobacillus subterraneus]|uniref:Flagellar hook-associated protein 2 n=1 Tax=Mesobacillus subterraneus TaxID=285983 RepID=A0A3R9E6L3_9BACI|nr:flagellar hook-associated protein 2 [Mesobacillus subterraneus]RSD25194.1 flagellar hook-associated protein 2 [Mesobacillus subterraneus]